MLKQVKQFRTIRRNHGQTTLLVLVETRLAIPLQRQGFDSAIRGHGDIVLKLSKLFQQPFNMIRFKNEQAFVEGTQRPFKCRGLSEPCFIFKTFQDNMGAGAIIAKAADQGSSRPFDPVAQPELRCFGSDEIALAAYPVIAERLQVAHLR